MSRNFATGRPIPTLPSRQTPLPGGERGFLSLQREMALPGGALTVAPTGLTVHHRDGGRKGGPGDVVLRALSAIDVPGDLAGRPAPPVRLGRSGHRVRSRRARAAYAMEGGGAGGGAGDDDESVGWRSGARLEAAETEPGLCRGLARQRRTDGARGAAACVSQTDRGGPDGCAVEPAGLGGPAAPAVGRAVPGRRGDGRGAGRGARGACMAPPCCAAPVRRSRVCGCSTARSC